MAHLDDLKAENERLREALLVEIDHEVAEIVRLIGLAGQEMIDKYVDSSPRIHRMRVALGYEQRTLEQASLLHKGAM